MGSKSKAAKRRERDKIAEGIEVRIPQRRKAPERIMALLGPTNSGKTHNALDLLVRRGRGVYAAPLRMLAREAYEKLKADLGEGVGLRTGEEQINPRAPIICATTEMAPMDGDMLVLDETHWAADPHRGWAWSRLLLAANYREMVLLGSPDVLPLLQTCFGEQLEVYSFERLGKLQWAGSISIEQMQAGDALVAYSRRSILHLASEVAAGHGIERVATLYGAMPLGSRIRELERLRNGEADLLVCTDVLGHGLNLPVRRLIFAETEKWDGSSRRNLLPWEAAQIAGRAGRYGQYQDGEVGVLTGAAWYEPRESVARSGLKPRVLVSKDPEMKAFQMVKQARIRPQLEDLGEVPSNRLLGAVGQWYKKARLQLDGNGWIDFEEPDLINARLTIIGNSLGSHIEELDASTVWTLAQSPLDPEISEQARLLAYMARTLAGRSDLEQWTQMKPHEMDLEEAEQAAAIAAALRWYANRFGDRSRVDGQVVEALEDLAARRVSQLLPQVIAAGSRGCVQCGRPCPPWFDRCLLCA